MKIIKQTILLAFALVFLIANTFAQSLPGGDGCTNCPPLTNNFSEPPYVPGLKLAILPPSGTNLFVNLLEADPAGTYGLFSESNLIGATWSEVLQGTNGQTNFTLPYPFTGMGFLRAARTDTPVTNTAGMTVYFPNTAVNTNLISAVISGGPAAALAVLVNDTNLADARWIPFSAVPYVLLGTNNGIYQVEFGFIGSDGQTNWTSANVTLDTTPPSLVITSPTASTVTKPTIQLQGYTTKPLSAVSYDIANALGTFTNQIGFVNRQYYDTTLFAFTTNWLQCYDLDLTNGLNAITLRVTDWAGNTTTTNIKITLDYSTATNPPTVQLYWPQNGTLVCNSNFTWRGWVNDPTATVTAQLVDTNGDTNIFNGIVERNGNFWVENLPMTGTNYLNLTVTDAAGNITTTNITVFPGAVGLTINPPDASQFWSDSITVSGTISDSGDYTVWVNGVEATYTDATDWTAANVPLPKGGTAVIQARAIPDSDNGGNGIGGSGGGPVSYDNLGNPDPPQDNDAELQIDKPAQIVVSTYMNDRHQSFSPTIMSGSVRPLTAPVFAFTEHYHLEWQEDVGTTAYDIFSTSSETCQTNYTWPADKDILNVQSPTLTGTETNTCGAGNTNIASPTVALEHCDVTTNWVQSGGTNTYSRTAQTTFTLKMGGKAAAHRQSLFQITGSATAMTNVFTLTGNAVTPNQIEIGALGNLAADNNLWCALPDGTNIDITPRVQRTLPLDYYTFSANQNKYEPTVTANGTPIDANKTNNVEFCVGEKVVFNLQFDPSLPTGVLLTNQNQWYLPPKYVNAFEWFQPDSILTNPADGTYYLTTCDPVQTFYSRYVYGVDPPFCTNYQQSSWPLTQLETGAWWISGGPKAVTCFPTLTFTNGQNVSLQVQGNFNMYRPTLTNFTSVNPQFTNSARSFLWLGSILSYGNTMNNEHGLYWSVNVNSTLFDGQIAVAQLVNAQYVQNYPVGPTTLDTGGNYWLDGNNEYYIEPQPYFVAFPTSHSIILYDDPAANLNPVFPYNIYMTGQFTDYIQFQPASSGSIFVTLGTNTWTMTGEATLTGGIITNSTPAPTTPVDSDAFPIWTQVKSE